MDIYKKGNALLTVLIIIALAVVAYFVFFADNAEEQEDLYFSVDGLTQEEQPEDSYEDNQVEETAVQETDESSNGTTSQPTSQGGSDTLVSFSAGEGLVTGTYATDEPTVQPVFSVISHGDTYSCPTEQPNTFRIYSRSEYMNSDIDFENCTYVEPSLDAAGSAALEHSMAQVMYGASPTVETVSANGNNARLITSTDGSTFVLTIELPEPVISNETLYSFLRIDSTNENVIQDIIATINI